MTYAEAETFLASAFPDCTRNGLLEASIIAGFQAGRTVSQDMIDAAALVNMAESLAAVVGEDFSPPPAR